MTARKKTPLAKLREARRERDMAEEYYHAEAERVDEYAEALLAACADDEHRAAQYVREARKKLDEQARVAKFRKPNTPSNVTAATLEEAMQTAQFRISQSLWWNAPSAFITNLTVPDGYK